MAWRRIGNKPLSESIMTQFTDAYMQHLGGDELIQTLTQMTQHYVTNLGQHFSTQPRRHNTTLQILVHISEIIVIIFHFVDGLSLISNCSSVSFLKIYVYMHVNLVFWVYNGLGSRKAAWHYVNVIMSVMVSQIPHVSIVCPTIYSGADQRKHQSATSLAFVRENHWWLVDSPHKGPVMCKNVSIWSSWWALGHQ